MDVYWQSIVHGMDKLSDEKLEKLSRDSENAHRALVQGIGAIGSLMITAGDSDGFGDAEAKGHLVPIGDLLVQLAKYSQALFENAGNAEFELKQREQKSAVAKK